MRTKDVFTPTKYPTVTFVSEHLDDKKKALRNALETGGFIVSLSGPSKSGKTVLVENVVGRDNLLHVTGAGVSTPSVLWHRVFDIIGTPLPTGIAESSSARDSDTGTGSGGFNFGVNFSADYSRTSETTSGDQRTHSLVTDDLQLFVREVRDSGFYLFIDDFHYVEGSAKENLAQQIKEAIRNDITVIVASVPYHSEDVIRANTDLQGRVWKIDLDYWKPTLLRQIADSGFKELNVVVSADTIEALAQESAGSPQLMQALCLNFCFELDIYESCESQLQIEHEPDVIRKTCQRTAYMADYTSTISAMREGPKTRGQDRKGHILSDGTVEDVYPIIIKALSLDPPVLTFRYNGLTNRITQVCRDQGPAGSSVTGACEHLARLANVAANQTVMEWDPNNDVLDIRDPYLLFFLRWGE